jgi:hypothetical protein
MRLCDARCAGNVVDAARAVGIKAASGASG